ncbi:hypothetical protein [Aeromonas veronii]|uniref:hypothetical protein n=1 Tax=Aeromonas veronii TaxID=654 RepID=UPI002B2ADBF3|nr:hypothetical protein VAWG002_43340 [Aeromonas veronii]
MERIKVQTAELSGQALNWAVAMATGGTPWITPFGGVGFDSSCWAMGSFEPDRKVKQGAKLLDEWLISTTYTPLSGQEEPGYWSAWGRFGTPVFNNSSRLVAGLRALVYKSFGDVVEVPEILINGTEPLGNHDDK